MESSEVEESSLSFLFLLLFFLRFLALLVLECGFVYAEPFFLAALRASMFTSFLKVQGAAWLLRLAISRLVSLVKYIFVLQKETNYCDVGTVRTAVLEKNNVTTPFIFWGVLPVCQTWNFCLFCCCRCFCSFLSC